MSLSKKIQKSIIENLGQNKDKVDEALIKILVDQSIKNKDKIDNEIVPNFQVKLNQEV